MCTHVYTVCIHPKLISLSCLIESTGTAYINNIILISCVFTVCTCRNENKRNKMKKHEEEKEYMTSLKAVSITTKSSAGGCDDNSSESEFSDSSDSFSEPDCSDGVPVTDSSDDERGDELQGNPSPLYSLYDCEGTGGSIYKDHIVEIAAVLQPLANNVELIWKNLSIQ